MSQEPRPSAKLDFSDFTDVPIKRPPVDKAITHQAINEAAKAGFTARTDTVKIDGRSLRRTGRTAQMNMKVLPETKARFQKHLVKFGSSDEFLKFLLDLYDQGMRSP
ncbi:hypothetical protein [Komagataeibacter sp. FNDCR2]|uniref:hypothetical protein n=1 Tax=Komagataeibacter sp. FNDCR2 TaxID=2878682 RepID=UPI001E585C1C|nr:hypothetical protein [Komagataeibacter sp. FNDCR2]MCE2576711.1 hypothetical protein [Komagataeibacter sp. FNDCR2]